MRKKNLLIDEYPLLVLPSLATSIGLNEAIVLQQLHYWLENPKGGVELDGYRWVYNTYEEWQRDNFPFWSVRTVIRTFANLEEMELVISKQLASYDRKKYYRVHYDNLASWNETDCHNADLQNGGMDHAKVAPSLTETTPETNTEIIKEKEFSNIIKLYEANIGPITPLVATKLGYEFDAYYIEPDGPNWIAWAIDIAVSNEARNFNYIKKCLSNRKQNGKDWKPAYTNGSKPANGAAPAIDEPALEATRKLIAEKYSSEKFVPPPPGLRPNIQVKQLARQKGIRK